MEIENSHISNLAAHSANKQGQEKEPAAGTADAARKADIADSVSLTPRATQLRDLEQRISELPVSDVQRVNTVRDAINDGSFEVNPQRIANRLIGFELALNDAS